MVLRSLGVQVPYVQSDHAKQKQTIPRSHHSPCNTVKICSQNNALGLVTLSLLFLLNQANVSAALVAAAKMSVSRLTG